MKKAASPGDDTNAAGTSAAEPSAAGSSEDEADLLELLLDAAPPPPVIPARIDGVVVGRFSGFAAGGEPLVVLARGAEPVVARALAVLRPEDAGRQVALMFEGGDASRPMVMGMVHDLGAPPPARLEETAESPEPASPEPVEITQGDERVVLSAEKEIVLRCGKASITLTRAGKILIKGAYVSSRASGTNRIVGGVVEIN